MMFLTFNKKPYAILLIVFIFSAMLFVFKFINLQIIENLEEEEGGNSFFLIKKLNNFFIYLLFKDIFF